MDVFSLQNYKEALKGRVKELSREGKPMTLMRLARSIPIQYTYLSKILGSEDGHLNEDDLYTACQVLHFQSEETRFLLLLRSFQVSENAGRRKELAETIEQIRRARSLHADFQEFSPRQASQDMSYLFEPVHMLIHIACDIPEYARDPYLMCAHLGISRARMKEALKLLDSLGFIETEENGRSIRKVLKKRIHYATDHPLMRVHQALLKQQALAHFSRLPEELKHNFMVTFSSDPETIHKVRELFGEFIHQVEKLAMKSQDRSLYQLNFELFQWM